MGCLSGKKRHGKEGDKKKSQKIPSHGSYVLSTLCSVTEELLLAHEMRNRLKSMDIVVINT